jgi:hypothetical protein
MPLLTLEFTPEAKDYQKAIRLYSIKLNENTWWIVGLFYLPVSLLNVWLSIYSHFMNSSSLLFTFLLIGVPAFIFFRIYSNLTADQQTRNKALINTTTWIMGENELAVKNPSLDVKMVWDFFQGVIESDEYYYLIYKQNKSCFQLLPKRTFPGVSSENEFRNIVEAKIGKIKPLIVGAQYRLSMIAIAILTFLNIVFLLYSNFQGVF